MKYLLSRLYWPFLICSSIFQHILASRITTTDCIENTRFYYAFTKLHVKVTYGCNPPNYAPTAAHKTWLHEIIPTAQ